MGREKLRQFKVISNSGIEIWFKTRKGAMQYIKNKNRNNEDGVYYSIIEYGSEKETKNYN